MKTALILATLFTASVLCLQTASAADDTVATPEIVAGEVIKVDLDRSRVSVRSADGEIHEFEASKETLSELKVGDRIAAKKRAAPVAN